MGIRDKNIQRGKEIERDVYGINVEAKGDRIWEDVRDVFRDFLEGEPIERGAVWNIRDESGPENFDDPIDIKELNAETQVNAADCAEDERPRCGSAKERIRHILREQVYGMALTRIIYLIATNYILGFDPELKSETKNFVQAEASKQGALQALADEKFGV